MHLNLRDIILVHHFLPISVFQKEALRTAKTLYTASVDHSEISRHPNHKARRRELISKPNALYRNQKSFSVDSTSSSGAMN